MAIWNDYTGLQTLATGGSPALFLGGGPSGGAYGRFDVGDFLQIQAYQEGYFSVDTGADFCIEYMCRESSGENGVALAVNEGNWPIDERRIWGNGEWCVWGGARFVWVGDSVVRVSAAVSIDDGAWHSVALDRSGGMLRIFVDGVQCSLLLNGAAAGTEVEFGGALSGAPGHAFFIGNCYFEYQPLLIYENHPYGGGLAWVRFTRASREASGFMMPSAAPPITAADPQWSNTTLMAGVMLEDGDAGGGGGGSTPSATVSIDTMTADTDPQGDWATRDGSAGRAVSGSIIGTLASGEGVQASFDGGSTWVAATISGASWSAVDPTAHATSWNIIARVVSGITGLYGALAIRAVTLITGPAPLDNPYPPLIISEHANAARYMATVDLLTRPLFASQIFARALVSAFDLDAASGTQLDQIGLWVGQSRYLDVPITGAWFSFDTSGVGFDQGIWKGPYDATTGVTRLADAQYRLLLRARIAANHWDGTRRGAVEAWAVMFDGTGVSFAIQDNQDMTINILVTSDHTLDAATRALITGGYLGIKPAGVHINGYTISEG